MKKTRGIGNHVCKKYLKFQSVPVIIWNTWPVSQTVKTLRSQRREYGFESHTGHQSESASIRKDRGAFCMTWGIKRHQGTWGDAHEGVSAPFKETHTAQVPCKGSCRRPWRASFAVSRGGAAWSQGGRWLPGYPWAGYPGHPDWGSDPRIG